MAKAGSDRARSFREDPPPAEEPHPLRPRLPEANDDVREVGERSAFLLALSTELARISHPQELISTAMLRLRERLQASSVTLTEIDEEEGEAIVLQHSADEQAHVDVVSLPLEPFEQLAAEAKQGRVAVSCDTSSDERTAHLYEQWYRPFGVRAIVSAPLLRDGTLVALLSAVQSAPRDWAAAEIELIQQVADIVWPALEKARADRALAISEERLRLAQSVARIGTWEVDLDLQTSFFTPEAQEIFGLDADEPDPFGRWEQGIDPQDLARVREQLAHCVQTGAAEFEYRYRHSSRGLRWIYSRVGVVDYANQRCIVGTSMDVTDRRQAEEALREVNQRKDEFLAMLAHELRNPLAPIRNAARILRLYANGRPELEWARSVIERQTGHLVRLVDDLLDVSRMMRGQIVLQKALIGLAEVVNHAVETSRPLIRQRKQHLKVNLPQHPVMIEGDLTRLAQVIANLLNNAAKYTPEGGHIWVLGAVEGDEVVIRVRDTGLGIEPALLPRVFDLFTQAERTLDRTEGGLGIGLTLVKRLVEMHGGRVEALSAGLGKGAEFIVRVPLHAKPQPQSDETLPATGDEAQTNGLRVLVVDDNIDAAESIAMLLSLEGYDTRSVHSAQAALATASTFKPQVVLLDIGLPEMDGYEVARRLRLQDELRAAHIVAVTGYGQPSDRERTRAAGFDHHLVKPVEPSALSELLQSLRREIESPA